MALLILGRHSVIHIAHLGVPIFSLCLILSVAEQFWLVIEPEIRSELL
jgi:hypothetical protein